MGFTTAAVQAPSMDGSWMRPWITSGGQCGAASKCLVMFIERSLIWLAVL